MFGWATRRALIRVTRQRPTKNGNSASEGLSMDRKSSEIFAAIERRLRADQEEGNHSAWAAAGSVDSSLNLLGVRSPSERAFKASIIEASSYHREWRAPLPRRKSTNPPANSCGREVTLLPSGCSRTRAGPPKYPPLSLVNRPTLIAAVMAVLLSRIGRAACPSEIAVIGPPFERNQLLRPLHLKI